MQVGVLGPVQVTGPDGPVALPTRKTREVLALLALAAPRPLSLQRLADALWDEPPPSAVKTVQAQVSRVRAAVGGRLRGGPAGYVLDLTADELDALAVAEHRRAARVAALDGDDTRAARLYAAAEAAWRGEPELPDTVAGDAERARVAEERLTLAEAALAASVAAGSAASTVGRLAELTARHPLREELWDLRLRALFACGRQSDALAAYREARRVLVAEAGVEPGPALQATATAVLDHSLVVPVAAGGTTREPVAADVPRYADAGGVHIAYGIFGTDGPDVLLLNSTFIPVDAYLEERRLAAAIAGLAAGRRVLAYDRRGIGLSDPAAPSIAAWAEDAVAVLDAAGAGPVHVLANADTGMIGLLLAATNPERVASLTIVCAEARMTVAPDYPYGEPTSMSDTLAGIRSPAVEPPVDVLGWIAPSVAGDERFRRWWDAVGRRGASPGSAGLVHAAMLAGDVRAVLPQVAATTLLISRTGCASYDPGHGRYLAEHLPHARLVEYPDADGPWFLGDTGRVLAEFARHVDAVTAAADPALRR